MAKLILLIALSAKIVPAPAPRIVPVPSPSIKPALGPTGPALAQAKGCLLPMTGAG